MLYNKYQTGKKSKYIDTWLIHVDYEIR